MVEYNSQQREKDRHRQTQKEKGKDGVERERWIDMDGVVTTISVCAPFIWQQIRETCHI